MICDFPPTATNYATTGQAALDADVVEAIVDEELNGEFTLHLTYPTTAPHAKILTVGSVVACSVPGRNEPQGFRIHTTTTTLDGLIQIVALHMSYDLAAIVIADTYVVNKDAHAALAQILNAANPWHAFRARSSVDVTSSAQIVRKSVLEAIFGSDDNSFLARWGGEILRDNYHLAHHTRLGADHGVVIRDRKNLTGFSSTIDTTHVATRILPVDFDGLVLPELYVDSPRIGDYERVLVRVMHFDHTKAAKPDQQPDQDELPQAQAFEALRAACHQDYEAGADLPASSYEVSFVDLASTVEYADFAPLETAGLADTVHIIHDDLAVRLTARVTGYSYNAVLGQFVNVRPGNTRETLTVRTHTLASQISTLTHETAKASADDAAVALVTADGKTTNHYGINQPTHARVGDTWFKPNGQTTQIWIYTATDSGFEWVSIASDINHSLIAADLQAARSEVAAAQASAGEALNTVHQVTRR